MHLKCNHFTANDPNCRLFDITVKDGFQWPCANKVPLYNNHVKVPGYHVIYDPRMISKGVKGSHVKFAHFVLLAVSGRSKNMASIFFSFNV